MNTRLNKSQSSYRRPGQRAENEIFIEYPTPWGRKSFALSSGPPPSGRAARYPGIESGSSSVASTPLEYRGGGAGESRLRQHASIKFQQLGRLRSPEVSLEHRRLATSSHLRRLRRILEKPPYRAGNGLRVIRIHTKSAA